MLNRRIPHAVLIHQQDPLVVLPVENARDSNWLVHPEAPSV